MPKVIVYVPVAAWRKLEARGLDPAQAVREFARRGYELTDEPVLTRRAAGGGEASAAPSEGVPSSPARSVSADAQPRDIPSRTIEPHFKPDPK